MSTPLLQYLLIVALFTLVLAGCGGDRSSSSTTGNSDGLVDNESSSTITGASQKGPFLKGSQVMADQLLDDGQLGSGSISTETTDNLGAFSIDSLTWSGPTRLRIDGLFFDEVSATVSSEQRRLDAVVAADAVEYANINLYTHMVAGRILNLMGAGEAFATAQSKAQAEWQAVVGTSSPAHELDLLNGFSGETGSDSANLLTFSAAVLKEGTTQGDLDAIRADFADDGLINGDGEDRYTAVQVAASTPGLLADARDNLQNEFNVEPPGSGGGGGYAWMLDACTSAVLSDPRVMCEGFPFDGNSHDDSGEFVIFVPLATGHYTIELFGDPTVSDDNTGTCSWRLHKEADMSSTEMGNSFHDDGFCGVEDVTTFRLTGGTRYFVLPSVSKDDDSAGPARFRLSATRVTEGKEMASHAVELPFSERVPAVVGTLISSTTDSFYRFTAGQGMHRITVDNFPCGSGAMRLELYEDAFNTLIAKDWEAGKCSQSIEASLEAGREYYLRVENQLGGYHTDSFRPAPGKIDFALEISKQ